MSMLFSVSASPRFACAVEAVADTAPYAIAGGAVPWRGRREAKLRPGLDPRRLAALIPVAVERCRLDLTGKVVLTEAACGAYVVTPILAACAGAKRVYATTKSTRTAPSTTSSRRRSPWPSWPACATGIEIVTGRSSGIVAQADIITNSGHVRPIDRRMIGWMKPSAVVSLMYEAWEFRKGDVDLDACRERRIRVGATDERHPDVDVFSFLGPMAVKLLLDAHVAVYRSSVLLLCDNPFAGFLTRGLKRAGATVDVAESVATAPRQKRYDAIVVALHPREVPVVSAADAHLISSNWPGAVVGQFWGDIDRAALDDLNVPLWPEKGPGAGHMGILPSAIGPEPVIRLQTGGLKVGELLGSGMPRDGAQRLPAADGRRRGRACVMFSWSASGRRRQARSSRWRSTVMWSASCAGSTQTLAVRTR